MTITYEPYACVGLVGVPLILISVEVQVASPLMTSIQGCEALHHLLSPLRERDIPGQLWG